MRTTSAAVVAALAALGRDRRNRAGERRADQEPAPASSPRGPLAPAAPPPFTRVVTVTNLASCTANFLYTDGAHVYLGRQRTARPAAAHRHQRLHHPVAALGTAVHLQGSDVVGTLA